MQTLELIEVLYGEKQSLCNLMGQATYPFSFINKDKHILLKYDGICFIFENLSGESKVKQAYINKCKLFKIAIYADESIEASLKQLRAVYPTVEVTVRKGIDIALSPQGVAKSINFGDELDYVLSVLKNPQKVYPLPLSDSPDKGLFFRWNKAADLVLNYFSYGLDIVINGETHRVKKFILHTNVPTHPLFHFYDRCPFFVTNPETLMIKREEGKEPAEKKAYTMQDKLFGDEFINTYSQWKQIKRLLGEEKWEDEVTYLRNWTKQLAKTMYYAREGAIFEVTESGYICSLTLFDPAAQ